jgi:histidyl-tRNA synthetase
VSVFVVDTTGGLEALRITGELRAAGISCDRPYENRSMKSQMKAADRSGATFAVIVGTDELAAGTVVVRPLRAERPSDGEGTGQSSIPRHDLIAHLQKALP